MEPVVLIHGYSSEGGENSVDIQAVYGSLVADLERQLAGPPVVPINVSRYISLDDSVDILSLALNHALRPHPDKLLDVNGGFNAIICPEDASS